MTRASNKSSSAARFAVAAAVMASFMPALTTDARAVSAAVQYACMGDYFRHCSHHSVGSSGLRRCMRINGDKLTKTCINALVTAGEISKAEASGTSSGLRASRQRN
jgi:hypothetical protein